MKTDRRNIFFSIAVIIAIILVIKQTGKHASIPHVFISPKITKTVTPKAVSITDDINIWKEYNIAGTNIFFKLPPELFNNYTYNPYYAKQGDEEGGSEFCLSFSTNKVTTNVDAQCFSSDNILRIGGTTTNFSVQRGMNFIEGNGYLFKDGLYYYRSGQNQTFKLSNKTTFLEKVQNKNGLNIISIKTTTLREGEGGWLTPIELGAIINTKNVTYPGIQVAANTGKGLNWKLFNTILSTFKISKVITLTNNLYTIHLPVGWNRTKDLTYNSFDQGENKPRTIEYQNNRGDYLKVDVNPVGYEVSSDMMWLTELNRGTNGVRFLDAKETRCTDAKNSFCAVGDDRLDIFIKFLDDVPFKNAKKQPTSYAFFAGNTKSDKNINTDIYKEILEQIVFK